MFPPGEKSGQRECSYPGRGHVSDIGRASESYVAIRFEGELEKKAGQIRQRCILKGKDETKSSTTKLYF